jgi:hypothetical protein
LYITTRDTGERRQTGDRQANPTAAAGARAEGREEERERRGRHTQAYSDTQAESHQNNYNKTRRTEPN